MFILIVEYPAEDDLFKKIRDVFTLTEWKIIKAFLPEHEIIEVHENGSFYENDNFPTEKNWKEKWENV